MRLICDLCREQQLAAIINIHDVVLAQQFVDRVVGLRAGRIVFDGSPQDLSPAILTSIYGEEDWEVPADNEDDDERSPTEDRVRSLTVDAHP